MLLAADIGGTKTHFALFECNQPKKWIKEKKYKSSDYLNFFALLDDFLSQNVPIEAACFAVAGPVRDGVCHTTNLPWTLKEEEIAAHKKIGRVVLINDLEATAYGLTQLSPDEFYVLNAGRADQKGNAAIIAAGTGLGEAGMYWDGKEHRPFSTEGGHCSFAAENSLEVELFQYLNRQFEHVSYERILSGPGLYQLYRFFIEVGKEKELPEVRKAMSQFPAPMVITDMAKKKICKASVKALGLFISIYGSESGNLALKFLSLNGFYIGGGIAPHIVDSLKEGGFLQRFISKGRFAALLRDIPIKIILNDQAALIGASDYARKRI